jgi:hypothetical protein
VLPDAARNDDSNAKTGPAARFLPHLTRHTKTNGNKVNLLKTLSDEGDDSTLLCNGRHAAFPFAASPQSPGVAVAVAGAPPFGFKGGSFFLFCQRFCMSLSSRQSEATRDLSQLFAASEAITPSRVAGWESGCDNEPVRSEFVLMDGGVYGNQRSVD